ncbi:MAG: hypothetical protein E6J03_13020 [Chloroflexi bacterium]|nr:MAG: hypothetical protein E6J03_13020 [Chloroflexota bacterium]
MLTIRLVGLDGTVVASTPVSAPISGWVKSGPDGAYWLDTGGALHRLGRDGGVTTVARMPTGAYFAVGASGRIAYVTSPFMAPQTTPPTTDNRLYLVSSGAVQLLPVGWTGGGLLITRLPQGRCGCGPFGMETVQGYTAIVDPATGLAGSVTDDPNCPVSGVAADGTSACFHTPVIPTSKNEGRGADALRILRGGKVVQSFDLSTQNAGGDATFNADSTRLAYATVTAGSDCGTWQTLTRLRVLDLVSGTAKAVGPAGLQPVGWLADGRLVATSVTGDPAAPQTGVVIVDPATGAVQPVPSTQSAGTQLLGLVTA